MLLTIKNFYKITFNYIHNIKSTYASELRLLLITFLFVLGIIYCIIIEPISLIYGGILYCFTSLKNSQIASELLNLSLCLHVVSLFSFIFLGVATDFLY